VATSLKIKLTVARFTILIVETFQQILGLFDTAGPSLLSFPNFALVRPLQAMINTSKMANETLDVESILRLTGNSGFIFPLSYPEPRPFGGTVLVQGRDKEFMLQGATFAHEAHHFLNICGSPLGNLLHIAKKALSMGLFNLIAHATQYVPLSAMPFPLVTAAKHTDNIQLKALLHRFVETFAKVFTRLNQCLLGSLHAWDSMKAAPENLASVDALFDFYSMLDNRFSTCLSNNLEGISAEYPPLAASKAGYFNFGGLQLAESVAFLGELFWLEWLGQVFYDDAEFQAAVSRQYNRAWSTERNHRARYQFPLRIASKFMTGSNSSLRNVTWFAAWMALLTPVDPRTLHLIKDRRLTWRDIHPGHRFHKVLGIIANGDVPIEDDPYVLSGAAAQHFDRIADQLNWPRFGETVEAIAKPHAVESYTEIVPDPYLAVYEQINSQRKDHPWCDVIPQHEFFTAKVPLQVPIIISGRKLYACPGETGSNALFFFVISRLTDLFLFGDCGPLVDTLFKSASYREATDAACEAVGLDPEVVRKIWNKLRRRSAL
jgi:hypothetical protein